MLKYLKEAFWFGPAVPGLGRMPVNALALLGFGILGIAEPAFWLLGAGMEAGYLALLASHPRFQRLIDARQRHQAAGDSQKGREDLVRRLPGAARQRLAALEEKAARVLHVARDGHASDFEVESRRDALDRLAWIHLKLLVARNHLESLHTQTSGTELKRRIADLEREMEASEASAALRQSQGATLALLRQRLDNLERGQRTLKEVDSDLARIEAQVDLALETGALQGGGAAATANIELASEVLEGGLDYGDLGTAVVALDDAYRTPPPRARER